MADINDVIDSLNKAYADDPIAIRAILINIVPCNKALADHPTIQVGEIEDGFSLGALGLINGVMGALKLPLIASKWQEEPDENGIYKFLGFTIYQKTE